MKKKRVEKTSIALISDITAYTKLHGFEELHRKTQFCFK